MSAIALASGFGSSEPAAACTWGGSSARTLGVSTVPDMAGFGIGLNPTENKAYVEGISKLAATDIRYAEQLGYRIKLLGIAKRRRTSAGGVDGIELRVHPSLVPARRLIANVEGAMNAVVLAQGWTAVRFNFRGVGRSEGTFDNAIGELSDAAAALDWVQSIHPEAQQTWVAGYSFGALIGMQLLMRRPEIRGFISIAPPANMYDFSFLAPCPSSGILIQGTSDEVVTPSAVQKLVDKLRTQRHITIHHDEIKGANHFFENEMTDLMGSVDRYLDFRLDPACTIR